MAETIVIALGGNALLKKGEEASVKRQFENARRAMKSIAGIASKGKVVITHGNGPQVGNILLRSEAGRKKAYLIPLAVADAQSEGELGYIIEQSLENELEGRKMIVTLLTEVLVDKKDPAFRKPTKPIGPFYTKAQAEKMKRGGARMAEDSGRGWRIVVPSPKPVKIIDAKAIKELLDEGIIVIAAGGGGIPVVRKRGKLEGIDAVIDKDFASSCLAKSIKAKKLLILTGVDCAYTGFGTKKRKRIARMTAKEAGEMLKRGEFGEGSMKPKIEAGIEFARSGQGRKTIIANPKNAGKAMKGKAGTTLTA